MNFMLSYLMHRQVVVYNDIKSTVCTVPIGKDQGTILGDTSKFKRCGHQLAAEVGNKW